MCEEGVDVYKLIEITNERLTDLQRSYLILNDNHHTLQLSFVEVKTKLETIYWIMKFFISPTLALLLLTEICKIGGII